MNEEEGKLKEVLEDLVEWIDIQHERGRFTFIAEIKGFISKTLEKRKVDVKIEGLDQ